MRIATDIMDMSKPSRKLPPEERIAILKCSFFNLLLSKGSNTYYHCNRHLIFWYIFFYKYIVPGIFEFRSIVVM
jgi:hypothetical protein